MKLQRKREELQVLLQQEREQGGGAAEMAGHDGDWIAEETPHVRFLPPAWLRLLLLCVWPPLLSLTHRRTLT